MILNESEMKRNIRGENRGSKIPKGLKGNRVIAHPLVAPITQIEEDCIAIQKNSKKKMSDITLTYLKNKNIISGDQYVIYSISKDLLEDRKIISELNIIEHINLKLSELYKKA